MCRGESGGQRKCSAEQTTLNEWHAHGSEHVWYCHRKHPGFERTSALKDFEKFKYLSLIKVMSRCGVVAPGDSTR